MNKIHAKYIKKIYLQTRAIYKLCIFIACAFAFCNAADYPDEKSDDDPIFADFCFYKDSISWIHGEDSVYVLTYYKMKNEITISINFKSTTDYSFFWVSLPDLDRNKIIINPVRGTQGSGAGFYRGRKYSDNRTVSPYDLIDFYILPKDSLFVKSLLGTKNRLEWDYHLDMGKQKQKFSGDNIIYISGFCTEEQLKIIRKRKKANGN